MESSNAPVAEEPPGNRECVGPNHRGQPRFVVTDCSSQFEPVQQQLPSRTKWRKKTSMVPVSRVGKKRQRPKEIQSVDSQTALLAIKRRPTLTNSVPAEDFMSVLDRMDLPELVHQLINKDLPHLCVKGKSTKTDTETTVQPNGIGGGAVAQADGDADVVVVQTAGEEETPAQPDRDEDVVIVQPGESTEEITAHPAEDDERAAQHSGDTDVVTAQPVEDKDKTTTHPQQCTNEMCALYREKYVGALNRKTQVLLQIEFSSIDQAALAMCHMLRSYIPGFCIHKKKIWGKNGSKKALFCCHTVNHETRTTAPDACQWEARVEEVEGGKFKFVSVSDFGLHRCKCVLTHSRFTPIEINYQTGLNTSAREHQMLVLNQPAAKPNTFHQHESRLVSAVKSTFDGMQEKNELNAKNLITPSPTWLVLASVVMTCQKKLFGF